MSEFQQLQWVGGWNGGHLADEGGNRMTLPAGMYRVRWPDGHESAERVVLRKRHGVDYDHGHSNDWIAHVPVVEVTVHGVPYLDVEVTKLKIQLSKNAVVNSTTSKPE